jgi:hypothetical protein
MVLNKGFKQVDQGKKSNGIQNPHRGYLPAGGVFHG